MKIVMGLTFVILIISGIWTLEKVSIKKVIQFINIGYNELFKKSNKIKTALMKIAGLFMLVENLFISYKLNYIRLYNNLTLGIVCIIIVWIFTSLVMYIIFGLFLTIIFGIINYISVLKNFKISNKISISFCILFMSSLGMIIAKNEFKDLKWIFFVALLLAYYLNIVVMLNIIYNPLVLINGRKNKVDQYKSKIDKRNIFIGSILILIMIIYNLYLGVLWVNTYCGQAFLCTSNGLITNWTLLYYTIISFTTIGYGDIVATSVESQFMSIIISITSVLCLIIYFSSMMNIKDFLLFESDDEEISKTKRS